MHLTSLMLGEKKEARFKKLNTVWLNFHGTNKIRKNKKIDQISGFPGQEWEIDFTRSIWDLGWKCSLCLWWLLHYCSVLVQLSFSKGKLLLCVMCSSAMSKPDLKYSSTLHFAYVYQVDKMAAQVQPRGWWQAWAPPSFPAPVLNNRSCRCVFNKCLEQFR